MSGVTEKTRVLTGFQPTGDLTIGNYMGAIKPAVEFSKKSEFEVIMMCADWHGLTNKAKIFEPREATLSILSAFLACGFEIENNSIILQSDFPEIQENAWFLSCTSPVGMYERSHAYKDALANGKEASGGLFFYPVLMASDIVTFDTEVVPVGKDQNQHLEYAADMAKLFNNAVGSQVFRIPTGVVQEMPTLPGTDGRKMGKSYKNTIPIFASKKEIEKAVKEIKTDSKGLDDVKVPDDCLVFRILQGFGSNEAISFMRERLERGVGYGYGHAKKDFIDEHERVFGQKRELFEHYRNSPEELKKICAPGIEKAQILARTTRDRARAALGLKSLLK